MDAQRTYIAIDLKSFYASVECRERGLDPLTANLVVADESRTDKTICLAVSPSLKSYGLPGRCRLFEAKQKVRNINRENPGLNLDFIIAPPRMQLYIDYSVRIYGIYLKYIAPEDIHVYSIDEVFLDATSYLKFYKMTPHELAMKMIQDVLKETGITATAGIGTNLYLSKVAMDIVAKHIPADEDGVRIAELDEMSYRRQLWSHQPITDFWRVGRGTANRLATLGIFTMGQVARQSVVNEDALYQMFGVNAELLIDHAWGWEPCTMEAIKQYKPANHSIGSGQVLACGYDYEKAKVIVKEMADSLALDLVDKHLVTGQIVLDVAYEPVKSSLVATEMELDHYGRLVPKSSHGSWNIGKMTSSSHLIMDAATRLYEKIVNPNLLVRRIYITATKVISEETAVQSSAKQPTQLDLFTDYEALAAKKRKEQAALEREHKIQKAALQIKKKFGKNALLKGLDFVNGATARERNNQIGGHKA